MTADTETKNDTASSNSTLAWFCLGTLLLIAVPQFLCSPLTNDASYYDIQARTALRGGVLYRDMVEPNLPGVVWIHMAVRSVAGWSSEILRTFDLVLFLTTASLFGVWNARASHRRTTGLWTVITLTLIYLSVSEWCQVQRDIWVLLPVVIALHLRSRQVGRLQNDATTHRTIIGWSFVEGCCLGAGVWIKPHILIPAACVWGIGAGKGIGRKVALDFAGVLCGGLFAGGLGISWMVSTGAWSPFLDMMLNWNPEYLSSGSKMWGQFAIAAPLRRLLPFSLVHLVAIPAAVTSLLKRSRIDSRCALEMRLTAALYLGWCVQVAMLQNPFDYIHIVPVLIGVAFAGLWVSIKWTSHSSRRALVYAYLTAAIVFSPVKELDRIRLWPRCFREGSSAEMRNALAQIPYPDWEDLERVGEYLKAQKIQEGQLTCWSSDLIQLHLDLNIHPPTRNAYVGALLMFFPSRRQDIQDEVIAGAERFVLTNFMAGGLLIHEAEEAGPDGYLGLPPQFPQHLRKEFPWNLPIVFRSGSLAVHEMPEGNVAGGQQ